jgi:hypothetical protein
MRNVYDVVLILECIVNRPGTIIHKSAFGGFATHTEDNTASNVGERSQDRTIAEYCQPLGAIGNLGPEKH